MILYNNIKTINFIFDLENLYKKYSIHRAFIVAFNLFEVDILIELLKKKDHNPLYIDNDIDIDLNYKIYIITLNNYKIINNMNKNNYNLIAFSYNIDIKYLMS